MLSSDLSVFDVILPNLDVHFKAIILFCVQTSPFWLTPLVVLNMGRLKKACRRASRKADVQEQVSKEVQRKVDALLEVKKLSTCKTLIDYVALLCTLFAIFVWIKSLNVGIAAIPAFDLCLIPFTLVWLGFAGLLQADMLPPNGKTVTMAALSYNLLLLCNQVLILYLNVTDRDSLLLVCRLFAGFIYCDHRKGAATQLLWILLKTQTPPHVNDPQNGGTINEFWDVLLWEMFRQFIFIAPMWLLWFAVEYFVKQFTALMVQKSDMNASLVAARSVLASQCDAEAYLGSDLRFQNPSPKMAHFFGMKTEDLENKRLVDLLYGPDIERFQKLVASSVQHMQLSGTGHRSASSLTLTFKHASGRQLEAQIYLGSIPGSLGEADFCHLIALNEVRDSIDAPAPEVEVESTKASSSTKTEEPDLSKLSITEVSAEPVPLNKDTLAFHAWTHSKPACSSQPIHGIETVTVVFEPQTLEVKEIRMKLPTSSRHRRKTLLNDCVIPGVWEELQSWLEAGKSEKTVAAPPIVPFVFPKFVRTALAARCADLSKPVSNSGMLILTLSDIRMRRFQSAGSIGAPTMGRGTASHVSRCSFDDHKLL